MEKFIGTKPLILLLLLLLHLLTLAVPAYALNVLAVLPSVWRSHYIYGRRLLEQLALKQNVTATLISPHAGQTYLHAAHLPTAIREIHIEGLLENWQEMGLSFNVEQVRQKSVLERFTRLIYAGTTNIDILLAHEKVHNLLNSDEKFDLLLVDLFVSEALLGFSHYYHVPTVILSPTSADVWLDDMLANPHNSALDASRFLPYTEDMNFWERGINTLMILFEQLTYSFFHWNSQEAIYMKHFESLPKLANTTLPTYLELTKNISLALVNSHPLLQYSRAYLPNIVEVAGAHLIHTQQLPNHLNQFIDEASQGVVYMSLGADVHTIDLAPKRMEELLDVFTHLKEMRFLVKWENENISYSLPTNVIINSWFPQEAILAHPNVKVFISSVGLLSVVEAVNGLTPLLAIPIYPEQIVTAKRLHRVSVTVPYDAIHYENILNGIQELISNGSYIENLRNLRKLFWLHQQNPIDRSLHYMNLILNSDGGEFLKPHARNISYLRVQLCDVATTMAIGILSIMTIVFWIVHKILQWR